MNMNSQDLSYPYKKIKIFNETLIIIELILIKIDYLFFIQKTNQNIEEWSF